MGESISETPLDLGNSTELRGRGDLDEGGAVTEKLDV